MFNWAHDTSLVGFKMKFMSHGIFFNKKYFVLIRYFCMCEKIEITTFQKIKQSKTTTKIISI